MLTRFRNEKLFVTVGVTVNLSPGQPKINGRTQLRSHSLLNTFDQKTVSQIFVLKVRLFFCYQQLKLGIANH